MCQERRERAVSFASRHIRILRVRGGKTRLGVLSTGLLRDGAVATGGGRASGSAERLGNEDVSLVGGGEEQPGTPDGLGNDIEDGKEEDLVVGAELAGTFAEGESDGVAGPDDNEGERDLVVQTTDLGAAEESGGAARSDELEQDPGKGDTRDGEEAPFADVGGVDTADDTSDDHDLVSENEDDDLGNGKTSEQGKIEEQQRSGESPVDVCSERVQKESIKRESQSSVASGEARLCVTLTVLASILRRLCTYIERRRTREEHCGGPRR